MQEIPSRWKMPVTHSETIFSAPHKSCQGACSGLLTDQKLTHTASSIKDNNGSSQQDFIQYSNEDLTSNCCGILTASITNADFEINKCNNSPRQTLTTSNTKDNEKSMSSRFDPIYLDEITWEGFLDCSSEDDVDASNKSHLH